MAIDLKTIGFLTQLDTLRYKQHPDPDSIRARNEYRTRWARDGIACPSLWSGFPDDFGGVPAVLVTYRIGSSLYAASFAYQATKFIPYGERFLLFELDPVEDASFDPQNLDTWRLRSHAYISNQWQTSDAELDSQNWWGYPRNIRHGPRGLLGLYFRGIVQARLDSGLFRRNLIPASGPPGVQWPPLFPQFYLDDLPIAPGP